MKKFGKLFIVLGIIAAFAGCKNPTDEIVELTEIEVTVLPDKTEYFVGEELDTTGLKVTATYSDESKQIITDWTITGYDKTKIGKQTVKVSYTKNEITITASFTVTVKAIEITKIEVTALPNKTEYFSGEELDTTGLEVTATYNDNSTKDVTADITTSGFDSSVATDSQTITVTYDGKTATFTVKIIPVLTGIEITAQPTKTVYIVGEELDTTGLEVTAVYSDESRKTVNNWKTSGFDSSKAVTNQTVTISYTENEVTKTAEFNIEIKEVEPPTPKGPVLNSIEIVSKPTKLMYTIDDDFDSTGLKVEAKYSDNTTKDITENIEVVGFNKIAEENKTITVKYGDKTDTFEVNVYECILKIDFYNGSFNDIRLSYDPEELASKHLETKYLGIVELTESFEGYYYKENGERWILCIVTFLGIGDCYNVRNLNYDNLLKKIKKNRVVEVAAYKDTTYRF